MAARLQRKAPVPTTTNEVPVRVIRTVLAEHSGSHDVMELGERDGSLLLEVLSVSLDQLHSLDVLSSGSLTLIDSFHLYQS